MKFLFVLKVVLKAYVCIVDKVLMSTFAKKWHINSLLKENTPYLSILCHYFFVHT